MSDPKTDLYFECHVTVPYIDEDERLQVFTDICKEHGFRVAKLLMQKTLDRSKLDCFCTSRSAVWGDIEQRMYELLDALDNADFGVLRYKIENTLVDVRR